MITRTAAAVAGLGLALSLSACSSSPDTAESNAAYCEGAANVQTQLDTMSALVEDGSSAELVKAQWNEVEAAIEANSVALSQLDSAVQQDAAAAGDALSEAVAAIPEDTPPAQAAPQYKAAIDAYRESMATIDAEVGCP